MLGIKLQQAPPLAEKSRYQQSFLQCMNLWEDFPEVRPLTFHPRASCTASCASTSPRTAPGQLELTLEPAE